MLGHIERNIKAYISALAETMGIENVKRMNPIAFFETDAGIVSINFDKENEGKEKDNRSNSAADRVRSVYASARRKEEIVRMKMPVSSNVLISILETITCNFSDSECFEKDGFIIITGIKKEWKTKF